MTYLKTSPVCLHYTDLDALRWKNGKPVELDTNMGGDEIRGVLQDIPKP